MKRKVTVSQRQSKCPHGTGIDGEVLPQKIRPGHPTPPGSGRRPDVTRGTSEGSGGQGLGSS